MRIFIVIDTQNDFITGPLGNKETEAVVPAIVDKLNEYNNDGETIVLLTKDTHYDNYLETQEGKNLPIPHCIYMTKGWSIDKRISKTIDYGHFITYSSPSIVKSRIIKNTFGSFELLDVVADIMKNVTVDEIILSGVCTDICVMANSMLLKTKFPETLITVDANCCAGTSVEAHEAALQTMKSCQINVVGG